MTPGSKKTPSAKILRSTRFQAPGTPLPLRRRLAVHNRVVQRLRRSLQERGFVEVPVPALTAATGSSEVVDSTFSLDFFGDLAFPRQSGQALLDRFVSEGLERVYCEGESLRREWKVDERHLAGFKLVEIEQRDLDLTGVIALQETLLKEVVLALDADLLGGANVTRLDRLLGREIPRLTYREALVLLNRRGWSMPFGEDFHRDAEATLVRFCGNLPVHVTHLPASLELFNVKLAGDDPRTAECVDTILPFAGETISGAVLESDPAILAQRLERSASYGHLLRRAREFAAVRAATVAPDRKPLDVENLAARYRQGIADSYRAYVDLFAAHELRRGGCAVGVARLLQYCMGLDSVKDAVIFPLDRRSFSASGGERDTLGSAAGIA